VLLSVIKVGLVSGASLAVDGCFVDLQLFNAIIERHAITIFFILFSVIKIGCNFNE